MASQGEEGRTPAERSTAPEGAVAEDVAVVSETEVRDFLRAKKLLGPCRFCHEAHWDVVVENDEASPVVATLVGHPSGLRVFLMVCENCGFTAAFSIGVLQAWKRESAGSAPAR